MPRFAFVLIFAITLSSCANNPVQLGKVEARNPIVRTYAAYPIYAATDKFSFTAAEVKLSTSTGGYHTIQIGDYLLGEVMESLKASSATLVRLNEFSSKCDTTRVFAPTLLCKTDYLIEIRENGVSKAVGGQVREINVGSVVVRQQNLAGIAMNTGDDFYHRQIGPLLSAIVEDFVNRANDK